MPGLRPNEFGRIGGLMHRSEACWSRTRSPFASTRPCLFLVCSAMFRSRAQSHRMVPAAPAMSAAGTWPVDPGVWEDDFAPWYTEPLMAADWMTAVGPLAVESEARFDQACCRLARTLHTTGVIEKCVGRPAPVIVHEPEDYEAIARRTEAANPSGSPMSSPLGPCSPTLRMPTGPALRAPITENGIARLGWSQWGVCRRGAAVVGEVPRRNQSNFAPKRTHPVRMARRRPDSRRPRRPARHGRSM